MTESGLTRYAPRRGTFVEAISAKDAAGPYHVRVALEPLAARELLNRVGDAVLGELQGVADTMLRAAQDGDLARVLEQDIAFHRIVWWRSQNELLPKVWPMVEKIWPLLEARVRNSADRNKPLYYRDLEALALTHQPLVDALKGKDPATPDLFLEHVTQVWSKVENLGQ